MNELINSKFKVTYDDKKKYSDKPNVNVEQKGSPARLFTNISEVNKIEIPEMNELNDYWFCTLCNKYTYVQNKHCVKCSKCTSKVE